MTRKKTPVKVTESLQLFLSLTETFRPSKELKITNENSDCQYPLTQHCSHAVL